MYSAAPQPLRSPCVDRFIKGEIDDIEECLEDKVKRRFIGLQLAMGSRWLRSEFRGVPGYDEGKNAPAYRKDNIPVVEFGITNGPGYVAPKSRWLTRYSFAFLTYSASDKTPGSFLGVGIKDESLIPFGKRDFLELRGSFGELDDKPITSQAQIMRLGVGILHQLAGLGMGEIVSDEKRVVRWLLQPNYVMLGISVEGYMGSYGGLGSYGGMPDDIPEVTVPYGYYFGYGNTQQAGVRFTPKLTGLHHLGPVQLSYTLTAPYFPVDKMMAVSADTSLEVVLSDIIHLFVSAHAEYMFPWGDGRNVFFPETQTDIRLLGGMRLLPFAN